MSGELKGKRALVTGASKGIGLAIARALATNGVDVVICGRDNQKLNEARQAIEGAGPGKVESFAADVSKSGEVARLFEFVDKVFKGLDILVNNAGIGVFRTLRELSVEEWDRVIGTNLSGAFYCSREAVERFASGGGGSIINISSLAGKNPFSGGAAYNASKFGLNGMSEATMLDHRYDRVRVSYILPGSVDTEFAGHEVKARSGWKVAPEDIAEIVLSVLRTPERTLISRIEVRPSRPEKN
jgi:3-oxoacyl-[acyl-carrier protein] reductase